MARTTRSQKLSDDTSNGLTHSHPVPSPSKTKVTHKETQTYILGSPDDQPATKQPRNGNVTDAHIGEEETQPPTDSAIHTSSHPNGAGDLPLDPPTAQQILDILEMSVPCSLRVVS